MQELSAVAPPAARAGYHQSRVGAVATWVYEMAMAFVPAEVELRRCEGKTSWLDSDFQFHIKPFHNRCSLIIEPKDYERWLAPAVPSHLPIDLVRTFPAEGMKAWRVAKLQGNSPHLLEPIVGFGESARPFMAEQ
jgi:hypothetical protein